MKIAFVVENFPVLSQTFIVDQIAGLIDLGLDVEIFAESPGDVNLNQLRFNAKVHYAGDIPKGKLYRLKRAVSLIFRSVFKSPLKVSGSLLAIFKENCGAPLRQLCWIDRFYGKGFDVVFCHFGPTGSSAVLLKRFGLKARLVTVFHGYDLSRYLLKHGNGVYDKLFRYGDMFLPISEFWKRKLIEIGCDETKILVHHMGIDVDKFQFKEKSLSADEPVKLLTVGRLTEKKGQEYAIKALSKIAENGTSFQYTIAGEGPQREYLKALVSRMGLQDKVDFTGAVSRDQAIELYDQSHIFILTSITAEDGDQEGIPVVLMEAQACGLPVISTFHTGIPELVKDGQSGFLVPEKNIDQLAEKLDSLISSALQWAELGSAGKDIVHKDFNNEQLSEKLVRILNSLYEKNN
ncbi:MAG: glycosyltransferase [Planctomycetes bacterium]|nr:glycosyltransferase [Planctomycetota bacterium]